jgi:hypothetical protein
MIAIVLGITMTTIRSAEPTEPSDPKTAAAQRPSDR